MRMQISSSSHDTCSSTSQRFPVIGNITAHEPMAPSRQEVEHFIQQVYLSRYGAKVRGFAPTLLALREDATILAAAGYRSAARESLFLETYLEAPVEEMIGASRGEVIYRSQVVEVGHLSTVRGGEGRRLLQLLGPFLIDEGFDWAVSTVTRELRRLLERLGVAPVVLADADSAALGSQAEDWGTYYEHSPVVLAIDLHRSLDRYLALRSNESPRSSAWEK